MEGGEGSDYVQPDDYAQPPLPTPPPFDDDSVSPPPHRPLARHN